MEGLLAIILASGLGVACAGRELLQAHDAAFQRWTPAQNTSGCTCIDGNYTTSKGNNFAFNGTCQNPDNDWGTWWCQVDPMSCKKVPFYTTPAKGNSLATAWDSCLSQNSTVSIDTEKTLNYCSCLQKFDYKLENGTTLRSTGSCIQDTPDALPWCFVYNSTCSQPPQERDGKAYDLCRGSNYEPATSTATLNVTAIPPRPNVTSHCQCLPQWNYTAGDETDTFYGVCASPGKVSTGPWCYVDKSTCKNTPITDSSGLYYDNCGYDNATTTLDTPKTINYCNCQPRYNATGADGSEYEITDGSCVRTAPAELPWCYVIDDTCITPVNQRDGKAWDVCLAPSGGIGPYNATAFRVSGPVGPPSHVNKGAIIGGVVGGVGGLLLLGLLALAAFFLLKKRKQASGKPYSKEQLLKSGGPPSGQSTDSGYSKGWDNEKGYVAPGGKPKKPFPAPSETNSERSLIGVEQQHKGNSERSGVSAASGRTGTSGTGSSISLPSVVPASAWDIKPTDIEICTRPDGSLWELGAGGFGRVYKGKLNESEFVAIKQVHANSEGSGLNSAFLREIAILKECRSAHVVQFLGACVQDGSTMLVTELMEGGSAHNMLRSGRLAWANDGLEIAVDTARGLAYLHSMRIAHLDIKSANVLLTRDGKAKIADVGLAHMVQTTHISALDAVGTFAYAAPELLTGQRCSEKADIWSFGVLLWELVTAGQPRRGDLRDVRVPEECSQEVADLIQECMHFEPTSRPSAKQLVVRLSALLPEEDRYYEEDELADVSDPPPEWGGISGDSLNTKSFG